MIHSVAMRKTWSTPEFRFQNLITCKITSKWPKKSRWSRCGFWKEFCSKMDPNVCPKFRNGSIPRNTEADQKIFRADSFDPLEINIGPRIEGCIRIISERYGNVSKIKINQYEIQYVSCTFYWTWCKVRIKTDGMSSSAHSWLNTIARDVNSNLGLGWATRIILCCPLW